MIQEKSPRISVIVPVYKVEEYIEKCLQSILQQTYRDFEIIAVNDQSPDDSIVLAQNVLAAQADIPFQIITRELNGGLSAARNTGILHAKGEFLLFVDSDDWIEKQMLQKLIKAADDTKVEMVICRAQQVYDNSADVHALITSTLGTLSRNDAFHKLFEGEYTAHIWKVLIAKSLFDGVCFPEGKIYEDALTLPYLINKTEKVTFISDILYNYLQRSGSITKSFSPQINEVIDQFALMESDFIKLLDDQLLVPFSRYIYLAYHVIACHCIYFSANFEQIAPTLRICKNNIKISNLIRMMIKRPSKTIGTLFILKISPKRFDAKYRRN